MFSDKQREQRNSEMADMIRAVLPEKATLVSFDYNEAFFGNMIVKIKAANRKHTFITDRGEIYHNGKFLCDNSCNCNDTFSLLIQMIKKELS